MRLRTIFTLCQPSVTLPEVSGNRNTMRQTTYVIIIRQVATSYIYAKPQDKQYNLSGVLLCDAWEK